MSREGAHGLVYKPLDGEIDMITIAFCIKYLLAFSKSVMFSGYNNETFRLFR